MCNVDKVSSVAGKHIESVAVFAVVFVVTPELLHADNEHISNKLHCNVKANIKQTVLVFLTYSNSITSEPHARGCMAFQ